MTNICVKSRSLTTYQPKHHFLSVNKHEKIFTPIVFCDKFNELNSTLI